MRIPLVCAAIVAAAAGSAQAYPLVQMLNFGPGTPNFNETLTFNKYNGSVSDIVSIHIKLSLGIDGGNLELDNDGPLPANGTAELGATAAISSVDVTLLDIAFQPVTGTASASNMTLFGIAGDDGDGPGFQPGGFDYFLFAGLPANDLKSGFINSLFFGGYAGVGTFDIVVNAQQIFDYGAIGGISFAGSPVLASGSVMITMEIVPAPGAAALLGLGGLFAARRRR